MAELLDLPNEWDAILVGAGPAGSLAAGRLARRGHSVLLVDKAARGRSKVCGGCLGSVGLSALSEAGVTLSAWGVASSPLRRVEIFSRRRHVSLPLSQRVAIARDQFDERLLEAAEASGARVVAGCTARLGPATPGWREVRLSPTGGDSFVVRGRLVLLAGGLGSINLLPAADRPETRMRTASRLGAGAVLSARDLAWPSQAVTMVCGRPDQGYVGLAKLPDGRLDVAAALGPATLPLGADRLARAVVEILKENHSQVPEGLLDAEWRSTPSLTQRPATLGAERVLLIGDAAGYVEPFTGEGIGWALRSALAVEPIAVAAIKGWRDTLVPDWDRRHRSVIGLLQRRCRLVCGLIGSRRPTRALVRVLSAAPWLAKPVLRLIDPPPQHAT